MAGQVYSAELDGTTRELVGDLPAAYGLAGPVEGAERFVTHQDHLILRFGVGGKRYFLKQYYKGSVEKARFQAELLAYLRQQGMPLPELFFLAGGGDVWSRGEKSYQLHAYVGRGYDRRFWRQDRDRFARSLGRFHALADACPLVGDWRGLDREKLLGCWLDLDPRLGFAQGFIDYARSRLAESCLAAADAGRVRTCLDEAEVLLGTARAQAEGWYELPHVPVHGDLGPHNCRFTRDEMATVVDWDTARLAPRLLDLAYALGMAMGWGPQVEGFFAFRWQQTVMPAAEDVRRWMALYREEAPPLSADEADLLPPLCAAYWLTSACAKVPRDAAEVEGCERMVHFMRHWLDGAADLRRMGL